MHKFGSTLGRYDGCLDRVAEWRKKKVREDFESPSKVQDGCDICNFAAYLNPFSKSMTRTEWDILRSYTRRIRHSVCVSGLYSAQRTPSKNAK